MLRGIQVCVFVAAIAAPALADRLTEPPAILERTPPLRIALKNLTLMSDEMSVHLRSLTLDMVDMRFDAIARHGRFRLGGGDASKLRLEVSGNFEILRDRARIRAAVHLGLLGGELNLGLPIIDLQPASAVNELGVQLTTPLILGRF